MTSIDPSCLIDTERYPLDEQFSVDGWLLIGWRALVIRWKELLGAPVWLEPYAMGKVLG